MSYEIFVINNMSDFRAYMYYIYLLPYIYITLSHSIHMRNIEMEIWQERGFGVRLWGRGLYDENLGMERGGGVNGTPFVPMVNVHF